MPRSHRQPKSDPRSPLAGLAWPKPAIPHPSLLRLFRSELASPESRLCAHLSAAEMLRPSWSSHFQIAQEVEPAAIAVKLLLETHGQSFSIDDVMAAHFQAFYTSKLCVIAYVTSGHELRCQVYRTVEQNVGRTRVDRHLKQARRGKPASVPFPALRGRRALPEPGHRRIAPARPWPCSRS
jgi:hypothetical protein